ncbi:MAG: hypothetical protein AAF098_04635 [Pseudomonadota bacterium]
MIRKLSLLIVAVATFSFSLCGHTAQLGATGLIDSITKAGVVFDGDVTGKPFDYLITLDNSTDPNVGGLQLSAGGTITLYFPPDFDLSNLDPAFPLRDIPFQDETQPCVPGNLQCTSVALIQGWPQQPLFPPAAFASTSIDEGANALVLTAQQDIMTIPGIKQIHLILNGLKNPAPGRYRLRIEAESGPSGAVESGEGIITVRTRALRSIAATSVFVKALDGQLEGGVACGPGTLPPNPDNPIYQKTSVMTAAPFVWSFLVWDEDGVPMDDLVVEQIGNTLYKLVRAPEEFPGRTTVGFIKIQIPLGSSFARIEQVDCPKLLPATPVIGATPGVGPQPAGRLDLRFFAGDKPGLYEGKIWLKNGNLVETFVTAE